jgi:small subunit ribosomal protein S1
MNNIADNETNQPTPNQDDQAEALSEERKAQLEQLDTSEEEALQTEESMESLMDLYEESFKRFAEGEVVTGKIISVDKDHVLVDIGYKSEGQIRIHEFRDENGEINAESR